MSLMEQFADPKAMCSLSFGEKMLGSTITMLMGIGITFLVLCILWTFISIMGRVLNASEGKKSEKAPAPAPAPAAVAAAPAVAASDDADVISAVIAAAIAAYEGDGVSTNLVVKRIIRVPNGTTLWTEAARNEHIDSRRF
ncbi:MAG: OadG family protein [Bacillota bacterium]|nr:OadG family protein [Bacillota bacterium]